MSPAVASENMTIKPYIGANLNTAFVSYSNDTEDVMDYYGIDLPTAYFGVGFEGGLRFGNIKETWNGGLALTYDYLFDSQAAVDNLYINEVEVGFSAWTIGFDNYIRIAKEDNKRTDLILGVGFGQATERINISGMGLSEKYSDDGGIFVLKFGANIQIAEYVDWSTTIRGFIPTGEDTDVDVIIAVQTGLKLHF